MAHRPFIMLGIESSCDETAAAVVVDDKTILANEIASQIQTHAKHGGVVPELAARAHLEVIDQVVDVALAKAKLKMGDIDGVAATAGPGLIGGVAVGTVTAKRLPQPGRSHITQSIIWKAMPLVHVLRAICHFPTCCF